MQALPLKSLKHAETDETDSRLSSVLNDIGMHMEGGPHAAQLHLPA